MFIEFQMVPLTFKEHNIRMKGLNVYVGGRGYGMEYELIFKKKKAIYTHVPYGRKLSREKNT